MIDSRINSQIIPLGMNVRMPKPRRSQTASVIPRTMPKICLIGVFIIVEPTKAPPNVVLDVSSGDASA